MLKVAGQRKGLGFFSGRSGCHPLESQVHSILLVVPENPKSQLLRCRIWYLSSPRYIIPCGLLRKEKGSCRVFREKGC